MFVLLRWLPVYYTRYDLCILCDQQHSIIPGTRGQSTFHLIRSTYVTGTCMWWIHLIRDALPSTFRYTLSKSSEPSVGLLDRAHLYAVTIRVSWRAIPYDYVFRFSTTYTLSVLYYAYALWPMLRLIQPGVVYTGTRTDNPYWPVRSIGRKHADEHAWLCLTGHIRVNLCRAPMLLLKYVNSRFFTLCYMWCEQELMLPFQWPTFFAASRTTITIWLLI